MRAISYVGVVFVLLFVVILIPSQPIKSPVVHNSDWRPVLRTINGLEMVFVPEACFDKNGDKNYHRCIENAYLIQRNQVTRAQFNRFVREAGSGYQIHGSDSSQPIDDVTWFEAHDFCADYGMRLPSFIELEYAVMGPDNLNNLNVSWVGLLDMWEVAEWTSSLYWDDASENESDIDRQRAVGDYQGKQSLQAPHSLPGRAAYGFRCAISPYDRAEWQPHLYTNFRPPTFTPTSIYPTDFPE